MKAIQWNKVVNLNICRYPFSFMVSKFVRSGCCSCFARSDHALDWSAPARGDERSRWP